MFLYDYLYVDFEKVTSLYSQLTGGVVELQETSSETGKIANNKRNYDLKVFKHDAGGSEETRQQDKFTIKPYHALLQELEKDLLDKGYLLDLSNITDENTLKSEQIREVLKSTLCIKCTGRIAIEDYEKIKKVGQDFPKITQLLNKANSENIKNNPDYIQLDSQIKELEKTHSDRKKIKELRNQLNALINKPAIDTVPQWILDGMETWIDTFLPNITNIRIYPFSEKLDEHIFGHLESSNFLIKNSTSFHFTYGSLPTEEFTLLGIVTSVPLKEKENFNPLEEFEKDFISSHEKLEKGFRGVFRGFDDLESMIRTNRYPRVLVHPILLYRGVSSNKSINKNKEN